MSISIFQADIHNPLCSMLITLSQHIKSKWTFGSPDIKKSPHHLLLYSINVRDFLNSVNYLFMAELLQHFFDISHIYTVEYHRKVSNSSNKHNTCKILTDLQDCNDIANNISKHSVVASTWAMFFIDLCTAANDGIARACLRYYCYIITIITTFN